MSAYLIDQNGRKLEQIGTILIDDTTHKWKKGFYRMSLLNEYNHKPYLDVLVVGSWLDLHIFGLVDLSGKTESF